MLAPGCGEPWFPHTAVLLSLTCLSYGDLFVLFLVLLFSFLAIRIHLTPNRAGRVNFHRRFWFFVCLLVLGV